MSRFLTGRRLLLGIGVGIVTAVFVVDFVGSPRTTGHLRCNRNLRYIGTAIKMYAIDHDGQYPPDLFTLAQNGYIDFQVGRFNFFCPAYDEHLPRRVIKRRADFVSDYWYRPGFSERTAGSETGIVMDKMGNHTNYGNILFGDGHVKGFYGEQWYLNAGGMEGPPPENHRDASKPMPLGCGR